MGRWEEFNVRKGCVSYDEFPQQENAENVCGCDYCDTGNFHDSADAGKRLCVGCIRLPSPEYIVREEKKERAASVISDETEKKSRADFDSGVGLRGCYAGCVVFLASGTGDCAGSPDRRCGCREYDGRGSEAGSGRENQRAFRDASSSGSWRGEGENRM